MTTTKCVAKLYPYKRSIRDKGWWPKKKGKMLKVLQIVLHNLYIMIKKGDLNIYFLRSATFTTFFQQILGDICYYWF